jgi:cell division protein FtsW (lipid II flippase)
VRQALYLLTGVLLMGLVLWPSYQKIGWYAYPLYGLAIALLALLVLDRFVDVPLVPVSRATRRWIRAGPLGIQPSEFMKVALILALARYLRFRHSYRRLRGLIPPLLLTLLPMVLILFQPDLGTLLMLLPVLLAMLFVAGARWRHLALVIVLGCATLPLFYLYGMKDYQRARIQVLFRQGTADEAWQQDEGYQLRQSKIALGTGGWTGTGYGTGIFVQYEDLLPEEHNDFIFAIIGHQWGFVGAVLVILAYALIVLFGLEVATLTNDPFGRLLAVGVVVMIVAQALLNICMTIGLAPITGMTLPFVSAGGSSLWANFIALGLLLNVAQRRPLLIARPPFEHANGD